MSSHTRPSRPADRTLAEALLREAPFAYVAMVENAAPAGGARTAAAPGAASGVGPRPYLVPMNFAYEPATTPADAAAAPPHSLGCDPGGGPGGDAPPAGRLYLHTGAGRKSEALAGAPRVCVAIAADAVFNQGVTPCSDGFAFKSVLIEGRATLLEDRDEREHALRAIVVKHDPGAAEMPFAEDVLAETLVYAVDIETLSYKTRPRRGGQ